jgi:hypothetical protein
LKINSIYDLNTASGPVKMSNEEVLDESESRNTYVTLMETNGKEYESWYFFIKKQGNEQALEHLQQQLESIDWHIIEDLSTFDLDMEHPVSAQTAKEMTKLEMNSYSFHRKFDGTLETINFGFKQKDSDEHKICRVFDLLGYGQIEDFIDQEDIDTEDLMSEDDSDDDNQTDSNENTKDNEPTAGVHNIPKALLQSSRPKWAKAKLR